MDKYEKIEKPREEAEIKDNEIRITTKGKMRNSISYATTLFKEKGFTEVILKAMGRAINKTVTIAEIIKRRIPNLHQITEISSTDITDVYEPLEEGLDTIETTRHVSSITIVLSTVPLDTSAPGYQAPLPEDQVKEHVPSAVTSPTAGTVEPPRGARRGGLARGAGRGPRGRGGRRGPTEGAGELAPEGSVVGEGEAPAQQATGQVSQQQPGAGGRPFGERRGRGGRGRRGGGGGGNFNQGGNGYPVQVVGYPPQAQQGFIGGYPTQPQPGFIGGYPGIPLVAPPAQGMSGGRGGGGYGGRGGGRGGSRRGGRGGFFTGGDHQPQPQQLGADGVPSGGRGGRGGRRGGRGSFHGGEQQQQQHGGGGSPAVQPQQPQ